MPFDVPFSLDVALSLRDGKPADFRWPLEYDVLRRAQRETVAAILEICSEIKDEDTRALALLVQGPLGNVIRLTGELALLSEASTRENVRFIGATPEFEYLAGHRQLNQVPAMPRGGKKGASSRLNWLRRAARVASWTRSPVKLVRSVLAPDHVAVSHNHLLQDAARRSAETVAFRHAETVLTEARARALNNTNTARVDRVVSLFENVIDRCYRLSAEVRERAIAIYRRESVPIVSDAGRDLDALREISVLPSSIWCGSAGPHAVRALALEVRRRGGSITGFDHGGSVAMIDEPDAMALRELAVTDRYVLPTARACEAVRPTAAVEKSAPFGGSDVVAGKGDATFQFRDNRQQPSDQSAVLYVVTIFRGLRQLVPPLLPDPVYLNWQFEIVEGLKARGIALKCKPHPEGILKGRRHPLEKVAEVEYRPFEEVRNAAPAFLYDYTQSTTFWEAVCTDRPITLIDFGITKFNDTVAPMIARRCHIMRAHWDKKNLPTIDLDELAEAVSRRGTADPSEFKRLLSENV